MSKQEATSKVTVNSLSLEDQRWTPRHPPPLSLVQFYQSQEQGTFFAECISLTLQWYTQKGIWPSSNFLKQLFPKPGETFNAQSILYHYHTT